MGHFLALLDSLLFYVRTGLRKSTVQRVFRDLSNRYLTPQKPGIVATPQVVYEIVTSTPCMSVKVSDALSWKVLRNFWVDRERLAIIVPGPDLTTIKIPLWKSSAAPVLELVRHLAKNGLTIPHNTEGVTYYRMPGEEDYHA